MGRPKGSIDKIKRKRKNILKSDIEKMIVDDYAKGLSTCDIKKKYNISTSALSALRKNRNIKKSIDHSDVAKWETVDHFADFKDVSGIYAIYFIWKYNNDDMNKYYKINDIDVYIGSSVSVGHRLFAHSNNLSKNKHYNKKLQDKYNDSEFDIKYAIIERCAEDEVLQKERLYLNLWNKKCLLNTWQAVNTEDVAAWLQKAVTADAYAKHFTLSSDRSYNGTPCKESNHIHKSGYGKMQVTVDGKTKFFTKHRIAYWEKHGEYAELVRHLCDNPRCYNPDHLASGNHRDNSLDKRGDFPERFENKWLEYEGDVTKLTEEFGWKANINNNSASAAVYVWEKKLNIREKYPEIIADRSDRTTYTQEMKQFIASKLETHTNKQIMEEFETKFGIPVSRDVIYYMGGGLPEPHRYDAEMRFVKENLNHYYDVELCSLVNMKFNMSFNTKRFVSFRFKYDIYRAGLTEHLKNDNDLWPYDVEFREFLRINYLQYTDEELASMVIGFKLTSVLNNMDRCECDMHRFIKEARLKVFGFLRDKEEAMPMFHHMQTGEPIYAFDIGANLIV